MNMIYKGARYIKDFYSQLNPATLTGAIDILVIEHPDGSLTASPFHVRFGKLGVLRAKEKISAQRLQSIMFILRGDVCSYEVNAYIGIIGHAPVNISINNQPVELHMKLGDQGEAFFVVETQDEESIPARYMTSPIPSRPNTPLVPSNLDDSTLLFENDTSKRKRRKRRKRKSSAPEVYSSADSSTDVEDDQNQPPEQGNETDTEDFELQRMCSVFSDSEIPNSVDNLAINRPPSPYSDSETAEHYKNSEEIVGPPVQWEWGQLPDPEQQENNEVEDIKPDYSDLIESMPEIIQDVNLEENPSKESSSPKKRERKSTDGGLYLDDVLGLDPMEANKYLQNKEVTRNDIDLAISNSSEPTFGSDAGVDSGTECLSDCGQSSFELSLCGGKNIDGSIVVDPALMRSPDLVVRISDQYLTWEDAQPLLIAAAVYKKTLTQKDICTIMKQSRDNTQATAAGGGRLSWLFGRSRRESHRESTSSISSEYMTPKYKEGQTEDVLKEVIIEQPNTSPTLSKAASTSQISSSSKQDQESSSGDDELKEFDNKPHMMRAQTIADLQPSLHTNFGLKTMKKSTRLTSNQLKSLNLKPGGNEIMFSVTSQYQGTSKCIANIYLWKSTDQIVVSDIDGTITKSDVFGQILPVVGKDWTQGGVAQLYRNIERNGYKFIYVSTRAIGQAGMTKGYLNWINQQGVSLPPGPVFLSPTSLVMAFHREVIEKKPEKFKIECLNDVIDLFPNKINPIVAGFGNKQNDVTAYKTAGISPKRIFIVNHKGELKQEDLQTYKTTYCALGEIVDNFFPFLTGVDPVHSNNMQEYNSFKYWKLDIPTLDDDMFNL